MVAECFAEKCLWKFFFSMEVLHSGHCTKSDLPEMSLKFISGAEAMIFSIVLFKIDKARKDFITKITERRCWQRMLPLNMSRHAASVQPFSTLTTAYLGLSSCNISLWHRTFIHRQVSSDHGYWDLYLCNITWHSCFMTHQWCVIFLISIPRIILCIGVVIILCNCASSCIKLIIHLCTSIARSLSLDYWCHLLNVIFWMRIVTLTVVGIAILLYCCWPVCETPWLFLWQWMMTSWLFNPSTAWIVLS